MIKAFSLVLCMLIVKTGYSQFDYSLLNELIEKYVEGNRINYSQLINDKEKLIKFTNSLSRISPKSQPEKFKTKNEQLAYWINAYNAYILKIIIENYPVDSIKNIKFIGFSIWLHKNNLGGEKISFKSLEDDILRDEFNDPRIHFAINCASLSCPPLKNEAYRPEILDKQLDESTQKFINDTNNFKVDEERGLIYLSSIFDWYDDDFTDWLSKDKEIENPHILDFIKKYYEGQIKDDWFTFDVEFLEYNWKLNDVS